jgi:hypothetical protein
MPSQRQALGLQKDMFRVVTKSMRWHGNQRLRAVHNDPWHPDEDKAVRWAQYLESTGNYDWVEVESNLSNHTNKRYERD